MDQITASNISMMGHSPNKWETVLSAFLVPLRYVTIAFKKPQRYLIVTSPLPCRYQN